MINPRRNFLGRVARGMLALAPMPYVMRQKTKEMIPDSLQEPWLERLTGRHRQFFDVPAVNAGLPLVRAASFLDGYGHAYELNDTHLNVIFGAHGSALALVLNDKTWSNYRLGTHYSIVDSKTQKPALRNVFAGTSLGGFDPSVSFLQRRGVRFIACMQSIAKLSRQLAMRDRIDEQVVHAALLGGLLDGVASVPAMIIAANRAQEVGLTYVYVG